MTLTYYRRAWRLGVKSDRKPPFRIAEPFGRGAFHAQEWFLDEPRHTRAIPKPPIAGGMCSLISSLRVQWLSVPADIAGVIRKAFCTTLQIKRI